MPPVFGPVSPSPTRLKSWAGSSGNATVPSHTANSDTSGPARNSSTSTGCPAASTSRACAAATARSAVTTTPLPAASPSSLTTYGAPQASSARVDRRPGRSTATDGRRRHPGGRHHVLGERLASPRSERPPRSVRTPDAAPVQLVDRTVDQRHLGADHHQVDAPGCRPARRSPPGRRPRRSGLGQSRRYRRCRGRRAAR